MPRQNPPYDAPGQPSGGQPSGYSPSQQGAQGGQADPGYAQSTTAEMDVSLPTLRWISMQHPQQVEPLGEDDQVVNSVYNSQLNTWEVLVLVNPTE